MAQLVGGVAGAVAGFYLGGPTGAAWGWSIGAGLGGAIDPQTIKSNGPRLSDLKVTGSEYGATLPWLKGTRRMAGQVIWSTDLREIATTTETGGKGGPTSEQTTYSYELDCMFELTSDEVLGVTRIWNAGKLMWSNLADADEETLEASANPTLWKELRVYPGAPDQLPDPTYQASVEHAPAYRGHCTVVFIGLQVGASNTIPNLTFEVVTKGSAGTDDPKVKLRVAFEEADPNDSSFYGAPGVPIGDPIIVDGALLATADGSWDSTHKQQMSWAGPQLNLGQRWTLEMRTVFEATPNVTNSQILRWDYNSSLALVIGYYGEDGEISFLSTAGEFFRSAAVGSAHIELDNDPDDGFAIFINGHLVYSDPTPAFDAGAYADAQIALGPHTYQGGPRGYRITNLRLTQDVLHTEDFEPPVTLPPADGLNNLINPEDEDLADVVSQLCVRSGYDVGELDVSQLVGKPVHGIADTTVTNARALLEILAAAFFFEAVDNGDLFQFVLRGGAPVAQIKWGDLGASNSEESSEPLERTRSGYIELPAQWAVTYFNIANDHQTDTQSSDRLNTTTNAVNVMSMPMAMFPSEAKAIADAAAQDAAVAVLSTKFNLAMFHARLQPTDVLTIVGDDGTDYRVRLVRTTEADGLLQMEAPYDDPNALTSLGITSDDYVSTTTIGQPSDTVAEYLDIPALRDADATAPGIYVAAHGETVSWRGYELRRSTDNVTFDTVVYSATALGVFGTSTTALPDWEGGNIFDESSVMRVNVGRGELISTTRSQISAAGANALLVGDEIIQYRTATLVSAGVYDLSGFLRGARGTEWAMIGHVSGERVVLLSGSTIRRVADQTSDLNLPRYFKATTLGKQVAATPSDTVVDTGVSMKPYAPAYLRVEQQGADKLIKWNRRSRLSSNWLRGIIPLGEDFEAYDVEFLNEDGDVVASERVTEPQTALQGVGVAYRFADETASIVTAIGSKTVGARPPNGTFGAVFSINPTTHARDDIHALPTQGFQRAVSSIVEIAGEMFISFYDGTNPSAIEKIDPTDLSFITNYTAAAAADYQANMVTDGVSLWAITNYSSELEKHAPSTLALLDSWPISTVVAQIHYDAGGIWWAIAGGLRRFDTTAETTADYALGVTPERLAVYGGIAFVLVAGQLRIFDTATLVEIASFPSGEQALPGYGPPFQLFDGAAATVGARGADGFIRLVSVTDGSEAGRIAVPNLDFIAGIDGGIIYASTKVVTSTVPYVVDTATFAYAEQTLDGGSVKVYQISATVGRGTPAELTL